MSMLARYKKTGGFAQLLNLIETCTPAKREQLLKIVDQEDPDWGALLRAKSLTLEKIFAWDVMSVAEVVPHIPARILAVALKALPEGTMEKATYALDHMKRRELEDLFSDLNPAAGEIEAARIRVINKVRELEKEGRLQLEKIDPEVSSRDLKAA